MGGDKLHQRSLCSCATNIVNKNKEALFRGTGAIYTGWMTS